MQPEKQTSSKGSTIGLALLFGVVGASLTSDLENFWFGAVLGALLAQVFHLRGRVQSLDEQLQSLRTSIEVPEPKRSRSSFTSSGRKARRHQSAGNTCAWRCRRSGTASASHIARADQRR